MQFSPGHSFEINFLRKWHWNIGMHGFQEELKMELSKIRENEKVNKEVQFKLTKFESITTCTRNQRVDSHDSHVLSSWEESQYKCFESQKSK